MNSSPMAAAATTSKPSSSSSSASASADPSSGSSAAAATSNSNNSNKVSLEEQLDKALVALEQNQLSSAKLFMAWRSQLFRLSLVVFMIVCVAAQRPSSFCLRVIKAYNHLKLQNEQQQEGEQLSDSSDDVEEGITFASALKYALEDSLMEFLSVVCCVCLVWMLHGDNNTGMRASANSFSNDFKTVWYRMSCGFLPGILTLYYQRINDDNQDTGMCLPDDMIVAAGGGGGGGIVITDLLVDDTDSATKRRSSFPVVVIFHLITSLALYFMNYQLQQNQTSIDKILRLKHDLLLSSSKGSGGGGGGVKSSSSSITNNNNNNNKKNSKKKQ
mmetsp:Transcript_49992/g.121134  ORF Transcript_49992/g.121134 Transcript_49992/m.121134 type:complete len:330 (-) Transcript_49992:633-1622(-)|eukprot:CAMPEP_0113460582 /NCGR_PEP_ID=MMETSP0014_2-20120614/11068_1 /TAXON_ID=2857 /ORGANISM="Nitzschia sp." /LENGTH=329 /DNA_ID=CAMNT_0000352253 /DNA_START=61 /DNA_END=1050 /DNA_ORIENTATION=- /assembly_acc=CAM_ASM_000159